MANSIRRSGSPCPTRLAQRWHPRPRLSLIIGWVILIALVPILIKLGHPIIAQNNQPGIGSAPDQASLSFTATVPLQQTDSPGESVPAPNRMLLPPLVDQRAPVISLAPLVTEPVRMVSAPTTEQATLSATLPFVDLSRLLAKPIRELTMAARVPITATATLTATLEPLPVRVVRAEQWVFEGEGHDLRGEPTLSGSKVDAILAHYGSPAMGSGSSWEKMSRQYGIDNAYALAFFVVESSAGTDPSWSGRKADGSTTHNVGNIVCAGYPRCYGRWRDYATWEEGIADWYRLIAEEYINARNAATLEEIIPIYAPSFENDVPRYIAGVLRLVAWFHGVPADQWPPMPAPQTRAAAQETTPTPTQDPLGAESPPVPGAVRMPDLIGMHIEEAYRVLAEQGITVGVVDKQGREHIPQLFDQVAPNTVVSSLPYVGDWVMPGSPVILGVRAPEEAPPMQANPPAQTDPAPTPPTESAPPTATPPTPHERIALPVPIELPLAPTPVVEPSPTATPEPVAPVEEGTGAGTTEAPIGETP